MLLNFPIKLGVYNSIYILDYTNPELSGFWLRTALLFWPFFMVKRGGGEFHAIKCNYRLWNSHSFIFNKKQWGNKLSNSFRKAGHTENICAEGDKKIRAANIVACYPGVNGGVNLLPKTWRN